MCERRVARRRGACEEGCEPNPKPRPKPNPSSADVAEGGVASIGVRSGTREEPGTLTQGAPVFPGSSRLGIEPKTPGWLGARPNHQADRGSDPNHWGIWRPAFSMFRRANTQVTVRRRTAYPDTPNKRARGPEESGSNKKQRAAGPAPVNSLSIHPILSR